MYSIIVKTSDTLRYPLPRRNVLPASFVAANKRYSWHKTTQRAPAVGETAARHSDRAPLLRRSELTCFSSASDDEVSGNQARSALSERSERSNQIVQLLDLTRHNPNDGVISLCALLGTTHAGGRRCEMSSVIVLNTDNTALHTVSVQHAIRMLVREVAIVEEARDGHRIGPYPWPLVLRLIRYVKTTFLYARTPAWSKRGVLRRDHHRCAYCQGPADTVDHLLPQSRGGTNSWRNTVAACTRCNNRKANRTPTEAGMSLAWKPNVPSWREAYHRRN